MSAASSLATRLAFNRIDAGTIALLKEAREEATERMVEQAQSVGANAVLNVRFSTSSITQGAAEMLAYGTAVVLE